MALPLALAPALIAAIVLVRFGLLALTASLFTTALLTRSPAALEFSAWYATRSLTALAVVIAIGAYGAYASLVRHSQAREFSQRVALRT